jgi:hypothetical protein
VLEFLDDSAIDPIEDRLLGHLPNISRYWSAEVR